MYLEYLSTNDFLILKNLFLPIINNIIDLLRNYYFLKSLFNLINKFNNFFYYLKNI